MGVIVFTTLDESIIASEFYRLIANSHDFRIEVQDSIGIGISLDSKEDSISEKSLDWLAFHFDNLCFMILQEIFIVDRKVIYEVVSAIILDSTNWNALRTEIKMAEAMES